MYNDINSTMDSIDSFRRTYLPILIEESAQVRVGVIWKGEKEVYLNQEGEHRITQGEGERRYWWNNDHWELVYN